MAGATTDSESAICQPTTHDVGVGRRWHELDRSLDSVEAAIEFGKEMIKDERDPILFSVGSETETIALLENGSAETTPRPGYNKQGGDPVAREQAASWVRRFLGMPASAENTFLLQQNGRVALAEAFTAVTIARDNPSILIPDLRWPMLSQKIAQARMREYEYPIARSDASRAMATTLQRLESDGAGLAALYTNYPNNPTGFMGSNAEIAAATEKLDQVNANKADLDKVFHIVDMPYFAGCLQKRDGAYLRNPYEEQLRLEGSTPWIVVLSFSKAFGVASPGMSVVVTDARTQARFDKQLVSGVGISYSPEFFHAVCKLMAPENDDHVLEHFDSLRGKYERNRSIVSNVLGGYVADGDANLTAVLEFPKDVIGRDMRCSDGVIRHVRDMNDLVEVFGNAGVVTVNCSTRDRNLVRLALSGEAETVRRGVHIISDTLEAAARHGQEVKVS